MEKLLATINQKIIEYQRLSEAEDKKAFQLVSDESQKEEFGICVGKSRQLRESIDFLKKLATQIRLTII